MLRSCRGDNVQDNQVRFAARDRDVMRPGLPKKVLTGTLMSMPDASKQARPNERGPIMIVSIFAMPPVVYTRVLLCALIQNL
jgi:hypothetical protein